MALPTHRNGSSDSNQRVSMKHTGSEVSMHKSMKPVHKKASILPHTKPAVNEYDAEPEQDANATPQLNYDDGDASNAYEETIVDDDTDILDESYDNARPQQENVDNDIPSVQPMHEQAASVQQVMPQPVAQSNNVPSDTDDHIEPSKKSAKKKKRERYNRKKQSSIKKGGDVLTENHARIWRYVFLTALVVLFAIGLKNIISPPKTLSISDVDNQIYQTTGETGFPLDRGSAIAEAFAAAYIPISGSPADQSILQNFYAGQKFSTVSTATGITGAVPTTNGTVTQAIQSGPYLYREESMSESTANFVIGALIYRMVDGQPVKTSTGDSIDYRWIYLNIGVYWDKTKDTFAIDKNSPTLTSAPKMKASTSLPSPKLPGNGETDDDVTAASKETVTNFMKAWAASDTSALSTLTPNDKTSNTMNGLDGKYTIDNAGDGLTFTVYGLAPGDNLYRALVKVNWKDSISSNGDSDNSVSYPSQYILKLEKTSDGKYLVQDINPYYYVEDGNN